MIVPKSYPTYTCHLCFRQIEVVQTGRGFPPDVARRRLQRQCMAAGCACDPKYLAGVSPALLQAMERQGE